MLRDKNLIPLSHQHQHALAMCVRLDRSLAKGNADLASWQEEITGIWKNEIRFHFQAEEKVLFPAAQKFVALQQLIKELLSQHETLCAFFNRAATGKLSETDLKAFGARLSQHIRIEEREFFEECQRLMSADEISRVGAEMNEYFRHSGMPGAACTLPRT